MFTQVLKKFINCMPSSCAILVVCLTTMKLQNDRLFHCTCWPLISTQTIVNFGGLKWWRNVSTDEHSRLSTRRLEAEMTAKCCLTRFETVNNTSCHPVAPVSKHPRDYRYIHDWTAKIVNFESNLLHREDNVQPDQRSLWNGHEMEKVWV